MSEANKPFEHKIEAGVRGPLRPTPKQQTILKSPARFKVVSASRRFGKSAVGAHWLKKMANRSPGEMVWAVYPTYRMAKEIGWDTFLEQIPHEEIKKWNERDLRIDLKNGCRIMLKGSDNEDSLRGRRLAALLMDEAAYQGPKVYDMILRPMMGDLKAPAMFISSPRRSWFTKLYDYAAAGDDKDFEAFHFTIYDSLLSPEEIERIKATTPADTWEQEYMAIPTEAGGIVYPEFDRGASVFSPSEKFPEHSKLPCVVGADWGTYDPTAVAWLHMLPNGHVVVSKEHVRRNWDVKRHAEQIHMGSRGRTITASDWVLDRSAFRKEGTSNTSIADLFAKEGIRFHKSEKDLNSGIDLMRRFLRGDGKSPWLHVSSNCVEAIRGLESWEQGSHEPDILAGIRYALVHAVKRRLTRLADSIPDMNYDELEDDLEPAIERPKLPIKRAVESAWHFDTEFGVPL